MKQENASQRIHQCLVASCSEYLQSLGLPYIYGPPAAMTLIQAIVGRRFYIHTQRGHMYLSAFRLLIGAPGSGKSITTDFVDSCLLESKIDVPVVPKSVTPQSLVDAMGENAAKRLWGIDATETLSTALVNASEYGTFLGEFSTDPMFRFMCEMFDGRSYTEKRRSIDKPVIITNPYLNMLAATQPDHFAQHFNMRAWKSGYATRCDFYYSEDMKEDDQYYLDYDPESLLADRQFKDFCRTIGHDLQCVWADLEKQIGRQLKLTPDALARFRDWYKVDRVITQFTHPWLAEYNVRRTFRLRRDAGIYCIARANTDYIISLADMENAIALHALQDRGLVTVVHRMMVSKDADIVQTVYSWALKIFGETKSSISHSLLLEYILSKTEAHKVQYILKHLLDIEAIGTVSTKNLNGMTVNLSLPEYLPNLAFATRAK